MLEVLFISWSPLHKYTLFDKDDLLLNDPIPPIGTALKQFLYIKKMICNDKLTFEDPLTLAFTPTSHNIGLFLEIVFL